MAFQRIRLEPCTLGGHAVVVRSARSSTERTSGRVPRLLARRLAKIRIRVRRFVTDRYAYRAQPDYLAEFIAFAVIVITAFWPVLALISGMALTGK